MKIPLDFTNLRQTVVCFCGKHCPFTFYLQKCTCEGGLHGNTAVGSVTGAVEAGGALEFEVSLGSLLRLS